MDVEQIDTPQKAHLPPPNGEQQKFYGASEFSAPGASATPSGKCKKKGLHPRTPNKCSSNCYSGSSSLTSSTNSGSGSSIHVFSTAVVNTPPAKRFQRVRNPFEPLLAERLHLPLIASPSLFQRPTTPQLSSTQFEWTIDEVSSLKPAHVEPHETQFHDSPDPEYEAKAQSAISSYFKEQQIVPSPVDCPLRSQRIILSELNSNTPITKPGRRIRDCGTQTELSLPVVLPKALEEALKPYLQPYLAISEAAMESRNMECEQLRFSTDSAVYGDNKDTSLRRKLFDMHNIVVLDSENKTPTAGNMLKMSFASNVNCSPTSNDHSAQHQHIAIVGKLSDSLDKSSFGSLSPISATDGLSISPHSSHSNSAGKLKSRLQHFLHDLTDAEQLSPIHPPAPSRRKSLKNSINALVCQDRYRCELNYSENNMDTESAVGSGAEGKFTPDRSSSPLHTAELGEQHSIDSSFNFKVSRLVVNSSKCPTGSRSHAYTRNAAEAELYAHDDTDEMLEEDDDMQVSQLSAQSFNCSSSNSSDTPRSKRRSASRKNLSQSFSLNWLEAEEEEQQERKQASAAQRQVPKIDITTVDELILKQQPAKAQCETHTKIAADVGAHKLEAETRAAFYRTDSGFNELPPSGTSSGCCLGSSLEEQQQIFEGLDADTDYSPCATVSMDVSMVCCSTPSKRTPAIATAASS